MEASGEDTGFPGAAVRQLSAESTPRGQAVSRLGTVYHFISVGWIPGLNF